MKLISWNVNGIRACENKGLSDWIKKTKYDVYCFQEIKALEEQFPETVMDLKFHKAIFPAVKKGYSGVATFSKKEPIKTTMGLGIEEFDNEGRCIISEFDDFILFNCYFPNGQRDHGRVPYKLRFSDAVLERALKLKKKTKKEIVICGDYNTAHEEIDLANPKTNKNSTGFLPVEREWMTKFLDAGFVDTFRSKTPAKSGHYTWWTYRNNCRAKNVGWRIDYFCVTKDLKFKTAKILPDVMGSDHCPIYLSI
ncbi:MAG: exodeoxyribonuclease III [Bacteriovoracaceae bacterium]|jgi:exodeoxyribonuclease-3|nr:exodeoxyribonuclease III [Bacteriovoracaceae bacterium]